jgi:hypothetical protein
MNLHNVLHSEKAVNYGRKPYVVFLSPHDGCWECERRLPPEPFVAVEAKDAASDLEFVFFCCSTACAVAIGKEISDTAKTWIIPALDTSDLLRTRGRPIAAIEAWRGQAANWYLVNSNLEQPEPKL